jgi:hypothetical protein
VAELVRLIIENAVPEIGAAFSLSVCRTLDLQGPAAITSTVSWCGSAGSRLPAQGCTLLGFPKKNLIGIAYRVTNCPTDWLTTV